MSLRRSRSGSPRLGAGRVRAPPCADALVGVRRGGANVVPEGVRGVTPLWRWRCDAADDEDADVRVLLDGTVL